MTTPAGWQTVALSDGVSFAVPPDARMADLRPIDSQFGVWRGPGYEIIYDYGATSEPLDAESARGGYVRKRRQLGARTAEETSFTGDGQPWVHVRMLRVPCGRLALTLRVSCLDQRGCELADPLFDSVDVSSR